jgi:acetyl esterase/lipase
MLRSLLVVLAFFALVSPLFAQRSDPPQLDGAQVEVYKTVGDVKLNLYIYTPADHKPSDRRAAIVFFFGGGWKSGSPGQFEQQCKHLAERGMVAITADYRVRDRHQTLANVCVEDGRSAIRWVRAHASKLGIDPQRVAAGGGSAGGHVAACLGVIRDPDESAGSRPDALVLFNPAVVLAPIEGKYPIDEDRLAELRERMGVELVALSPYHHVDKDAPPTIVFHGQADTAVPYRTAELFTEAMTAVGAKCRLVGYEGMPHGFFNYGREGGKYEETLAEMDKFLTSLGYLDARE